MVRLHANQVPSRMMLAMPDRPTFDYWKSFKTRPDLYRTTFENDDILIVARRETVKPPP